MERLSSEQIREFIHPNAFSVSRPSAIEAAGTRPSASTLRTGSINESLTLLPGATSRLGMIRANLELMQEAAEDGRRTRSETRRDEAYGKLRSLSAGIDQIVEQTRFNGETVLDGKPWELSLTQGKHGAKEDLDLNGFNTFGEDSLQLVKRTEAGKSEIWYDFVALQNNVNSGIEGLDIVNPDYHGIAEGERELADGDYDLTVLYNGPKSSLELRDANGLLMAAVEGIDLSGTGAETVDLGVGVTLTFAKENFDEAVDKFDYEANGPAKLMAKLTYSRVLRHELDDGVDRSALATVGLISETAARDTEGRMLSLVDVSANAAGDERTALESGSYNLRVNYNGAKSTVELVDSNGILRGYKDEVDLTGEGETTIDLGVGMKITVGNEGFGDSKGRFTAQLDYEAPQTGSASFDFDAYSERIDAALEMLEAEEGRLAQTQQRVESVLQLRQPAQSTGTLLATEMLAFEDDEASLLFNNTLGATQAGSSLNLRA